MENEEKNTIGKDFTLLELGKFVAAPVITRLFVSLLQTMDDSLFVSRYCGQYALAAFSVAMPWFMLVDGLGMLCMGASTHCSIRMGRKENEQAKSDFTTMCLVTFGLGFVILLILTLFLEPILKFLGETELLMPYAKQYMSVSRFYAPLSLVSYIFNGFYVVAGKPKCSMIVTLLQTFCNVFGDWLFIVKLNCGIVGAAYANFLGFVAIDIFALIFYSNKKREISFVKPNSELLPLLKDVIKLGKTQVITSLSISFNSFITNNIELKLAGEILVSACTIVNNVQFMFMNSMFGLIGTTSPIISYAYGEKNAKKLAKTFKQVIILLTILMAIIAGIYIGGKNIFLDLYLGGSGSKEIRDLAYHGMTIAPLSFLFFGYNVFTQEFFTAVSNSKTATTLSVIENIIFTNLAVFVLTALFKTEGVWHSFWFSEFLTFFFTVFAIYRNKDKYGLGKDGVATIFIE